MAKPEEKKNLQASHGNLKNSVRKKKHAFTLLFPVAFFFKVNHHFIST